ncbi:hypothetical protein U1Q18_013531, partial [Sarracenia purpurea var. burkii]
CFVLFIQTHSPCPVKVPHTVIRFLFVDLPFLTLDRRLELMHIQLRDLEDKAQILHQEVQAGHRQILRLDHAITSIHYRMRDIDHCLLNIDDNACATIATTRKTQDDPAQDDFAA